MKRTLTIIAYLILAGCTDANIKKPFVIIRKEYHGDDTYYGFRDANGSYEAFYERDTIYHIGDTIK